MICSWLEFALGVNAPGVKKAADRRLLEQSPKIKAEAPPD
jgi:hypothetical protein